MPATIVPAVNHWPDPACARAFWGQQELPGYRQLLADTTAWLEPRPGQRWLDLGCGSGQLTQTLWLESGGRLAEIVGLDCAAVHARAFRELDASLEPAPQGRIRFVHSDFSTGLAAWPDGRFDGAVSGMAIQYAESYSEEHGGWTTAAYDRLLAEIHRVLRPGGAFVFSVNVPEPAWERLALGTLTGVFRARRPTRYLQKAWRMWRYGRWLKQEARRGRFHYLPCPVVVGKLAAAGFVAIEHQLSYSGLAYLLRCRKPAEVYRWDGADSHS